MDRACVSTAIASRRSGTPLTRVSAASLPPRANKGRLHACPQC